MADLVDQLPLQGDRNWTRRKKRKVDDLEKASPGSEKKRLAPKSASAKPKPAPKTTGKSTKAVKRKQKGTPSRNNDSRREGRAELSTTAPPALNKQKDQMLKTMMQSNLPEPLLSALSEHMNQHNEGSSEAIVKADHPSPNQTRAKGGILRESTKRKSPRLNGRRPSVPDDDEEDDSQDLSDDESDVEDVVHNSEEEDEDDQLTLSNQQNPITHGESDEEQEVSINLGTSHAAVETAFPQDGHLGALNQPVSNGDVQELDNA